jgi:hypothetical protein
LKIFLGSPHRGSFWDLEDALYHLLLAPPLTFIRNLTEKVRVLARLVEYTNGEFYDTNLLIRAFIFNIYNQGVLTFKPRDDASETGSDMVSCYLHPQNPLD